MNISASNSSLSGVNRRYSMGGLPTNDKCEFIESVRHTPGLPSDYDTVTLSRVDPCGDFSMPSNPGNLIPRPLRPQPSLPLQFRTGAILANHNPLPWS